MGNELFDHLNRITFSKESLEDLSDYNPWMTNRFLSMDYTTVLFANAMNRYWTLSNKMQFTFLMETIPKKKRYLKYYKKNKSKSVDVELKAVMKKYGVSAKIAEGYIDILDNKQLKEIVNEMSTYGGR